MVLVADHRSDVVDDGLDHPCTIVVVVLMEEIWWEASPREAMGIDEMAFAPLYRRPLTTTLPRGRRAGREGAASGFGAARLSPGKARCLASPVAHLRTTPDNSARRDEQVDPRSRRSSEPSARIGLSLEPGRELVLGASNGCW